MARRLTLADISNLPYPGTAIPDSIRFSPDGGALTYLYSQEGTLVRSLWWHDLASGERRVIAEPQPGTEQEADLSLEDRLRRERSRTLELGVTEYAWAHDAPVLMAPVGGQVFVGGGAEPLRPVQGADRVSAAAISPTGSHVAFVRDGDIWMVSLDGGAPRRLTTDAGDGTFNGLAEFIAAEELDRFEGMWWSRDGDHLAYSHTDERGVPPFIISHLGDDSPSHETHRYPFAGGPNAAVTLRVASVSRGGPGVDVELGIGDGYLARVVPEPSGSWLVAVLPRDQRSLRWLRVTPGGEAVDLWTESATPWINLDSDTHVLADGRILRSTERTRFRHLELRDPDGAPGPQLTAGDDWMVTRVVHVDEARNEVLFVATVDFALERHVFATPLDAPSPTGEPLRLTSEPGWHDAVVAPGGRRWVDTWSSPASSPTVVLHDRDADSRTTIHDASETAGTLGVEPPEIFRIPSGDGHTPINAALYRPAEPAADPPPCVVWVYGGPHWQHVTRSWATSGEALRYYLAQCGVAVLVVDNRGSTDRGLAFEAPIAGHLGSVELEDQAAAVEHLVAAGVIASAGVAITGGSYGGFMTLTALIKRPDLFRAGVAFAPVTDQAGYDTAYVERYLGDPQADPEAYRRSSPLQRAAELPESLLLIHGAIDENVHLRHSVRLIGALQAAGRRIELVVLPADRHRARSPEGLRTRDARMVAHLLAHLGVSLPEELATYMGTGSTQPG